MKRKIMRGLRTLSIACFMFMMFGWLLPTKVLAADQIIDKIELTLKKEPVTGDKVDRLFGDVVVPKDANYEVSGDFSNLDHYRWVESSKPLEEPRYLYYDTDYVWSLSGNKVAFLSEPFTFKGGKYYMLMCNIRAKNGYKFENVGSSSATTWQKCMSATVNGKTAWVVNANGLGVKEEDKEYNKLVWVCCIFGPTEYTEKVAAPVFTLEKEGEPGEKQKIKVTTATEGATIYVALDTFEDPYQQLHPYSSGDTIWMTIGWSPWSLRAYAVKDGCIDSDMTETTLTITPGYMISVQAGSGGTITPGEDERVWEGEDRTYTITPDDGYQVKDIIVDGSSLSAQYSFENIKSTGGIALNFTWPLKNITSDHSISATFEKISSTPSTPGGTTPTPGESKPGTTPNPGNTNPGNTQPTQSAVQPSITLNADSIVLKVKQTSSVLKATDLIPGDRVVSWESSNKKVFTVRGNGKLKAGKKPGKAKLTITLQSGLTKTIPVKVQKGTVKTKKITATKTVTLQKGQKFKLVPVLTPITTQEKVKYTSSKKKIATVNSKGQIVAKKTGKTVITIKSGKKTAKCTVIVK